MRLSLADWLKTRNPPAPANLLERMLTEVSRLGLMDSEVAPKSLADAGESILRTLDESGCTDRSSAIDLLAADALFTYAFEAASDESDAEIESAARYVLDRVTNK